MLWPIYYLFIGIISGFNIGTIIVPENVPNYKNFASPLRHVGIISNILSVQPMLLAVRNLLKKSILKQEEKNKKKSAKWMTVKVNDIAPHCSVPMGF